MLLLPTLPSRFSSSESIVATSNVMASSFRLAVVKNNLFQRSYCSGADVNLPGPTAHCRYFQEYRNMKDGRFLHG